VEINRKLHNRRNVASCTASGIALVLPHRTSSSQSAPRHRQPSPGRKGQLENIIEPSAQLGRPFPTSSPIEEAGDLASGHSSQRQPSLGERPESNEMRPWRHLTPEQHEEKAVACLRLSRDRRVAGDQRMRFRLLGQRHRLLARLRRQYPHGIRHRRPECL